jgi:cytochrome P450
LLSELASSGVDLVPFQIGRHPAFLLNDPTHIEHVLVRHPDVFVKGRGFERARQLLGNGLLTACGNGHAERRSVAQPAFHSRSIRRYVPAMIDQMVRVRDRWHAGHEIEIASEMRHLTLAIAGEALFGTDLADVRDDIGRAVATATPSVDGLLALVERPVVTRRARHTLEQICRGIVEKRRRSSDAHDDLLAMLIAAEPESCDPTPQLIDDCLTFLLAGHDTLAHALTWTWVLLAQNRDADGHLGDESRRVLGTGTPGPEDVGRLVYTRRVLAEGLRLFPPAWVIVRHAATAHRIGRTDIPEGAILVASPYVTHRDPKLFPAPLAFDPERWDVLPQATGVGATTGGRQRWAFFPFGAGSRSCVGESFAWMAGTVVLAVLAGRWRLTGPREVVVPSPRITMRPNAPVWMTVEDRQG